MTSLSGSLSLASTFPVTTVSSGPLAVSSVATGAGFLTVQVKISRPDAPDGSVAVTTTMYGLCWLASFVSLPWIRPVAGSMDRPGGNPVAEYDQRVAVRVEERFRCKDRRHQRAVHAVLGADGAAIWVRAGRIVHRRHCKGEHGGIGAAMTVRDGIGRNGSRAVIVEERHECIASVRAYGERADTGNDCCLARRIGRSADHELRHRQLHRRLYRYRWSARCR